MSAGLCRVLLVSTLLVGAPGLSHAQGRWARQVDARLQRAVAALRSAQTIPAPDRRSGPLNEEEAATFETEMQAGTPYAVVGVCDDDCARLELVVTTLSGNDLAKDRGGENFPMIRLTPSHSARYRVRVVMETCRVNPCWYAVGVIPLIAATPR